MNDVFESCGQLQEQEKLDARATATGFVTAANSSVSHGSLILNPPPPLPLQMSYPMSELLKAGLACKLTIALHVIHRYFGVLN